MITRYTSETHYHCAIEATSIKRPLFDYIFQHIVASKMLEYRQLPDSMMLRSLSP